MCQIPLNPTKDGICRTIKSQYWKNSLANFIRDGGYGATAVAVLDSRSDMEIEAEWESIQPRWDCSMYMRGASRRSRTEDNCL